MCCRKGFSVNYKDTEHFIVTKRFMDAPEKMLERNIMKGGIFF